MVAMEKVAWIELTVALVTIVLVTVLLPWLGAGAVGAFGLLGLMALGLWFVRDREQRVVIDERDREIERWATRRGIEAAWITLLVSLIVIVVWAGYNGETVVSISLLTWLVWVQFALCYGVKGLTTLLHYRRGRRAT